MKIYLKRWISYSCWKRKNSEFLP